MMDERALIQGALAGDRESFAGLVRAYQTPVFNLAYRMLGTAAEAEEAAQETFLRVYQRLDTYDASCKFSSWILAIASHYCVDRLRRRRLKCLPLDEVPPQAAQGQPAEAPEACFLERERQQEMQELLAELPEDYRVALALRYWHDLSYEEMAETLHTSEGAIKSRLHRARELLAARLSTRQARPLGSRLRRSVAGHAVPQMP